MARAEAAPWVCPQFDLWPILEGIVMDFSNTKKSWGTSRSSKKYSAIVVTYVLTCIKSLKISLDNADAGIVKQIVWEICECFW